MNKLISGFFLGFLIASQTVLAGLPPTTGKVSGDSNDLTTFKYQFPNFTGTHTGTQLSLGVNNLAGGGTNADLSATGGTSQFLKQATVGAAITVVRPACADLSNAATSCSTDATNMGNAASGTLVTGRGGTGVAAPPTSASASAFAAWDASVNLPANNHLQGYTTTATAAGTTTLSITSTYQQFFTGSSTQTVTLPVASTLALGHTFYVTNLSTGIVTVKSSGANTIAALPGVPAATIIPPTVAKFTCILASGTGTASWQMQSFPAFDANFNTRVNSVISGFTTTATSGSPVTLTATSTYYQRFTGSTAQTVILPTTVGGANTKTGVGYSLYLVNASSAIINVQDANNNGASGTVNVFMPPGSAARFWVYTAASEDWVVAWDALPPRSDNINYIGNPDAESGTTGWATYADAAANVPVDCTGGSATSLTFSQSLTTPLHGGASFSMAQANSTSLQGKGVSYQFTIDTADQGKPLQVSYDYNASATFVAADGITAPLNDATTSTNAGNSDVEDFIYDVTNAVKIPITPQVVTAKGASNYFTFKGTFQTASNSTSYRWCKHVASTSANATGWTFKWDNAKVSPQITTTGGAITDWASYTPTVTGYGTGSGTAVGYWRRHGDSVQIWAQVTKDGSGGTGTAAYTLSVPSGITLDTNKSTGDNLGTGAVTTASYYVEGPVLYSAGTLLSRNTGTANNIRGSDLSAGALFSINAVFPVTGWSSNVQMSSDTDTRVVSARYTASAGQTPGANAVINFDTKSWDTHAMVTTGAGAWKATAPVSGFYEFCASIISSNAMDISLYKNAVKDLSMFSMNTTTTTMTGCVTATAVAGDYFGIYTSGAGAISSNASWNWVTVRRISGPATIAASEKIRLTYTGNAAGSITANSGSFDFITKVTDSHGAWSGTTFTAPRADFYCFAGNINFSAGVAPGIYAYVNGVSKTLIADVVSATYHNFNGCYPLSAGDLLTFREDGTNTLANSATLHSLSIWSQ